MTSSTDSLAHDGDHGHGGPALHAGSGSYRSVAPVYSEQKAGAYIASGYWGGDRYALSSGTVTVDIDALAEAGQVQARRALDMWSAVTGLTFVEQAAGASLVFGDADHGAYTEFFPDAAGRIRSAIINIEAGWAGGGTRTDSYVFQTYLHEIGHALGLGHAGAYNGHAAYGTHNVYANDSWQMSVMSYFSQAENWTIDASYAYAITPMAADIEAIRTLYGVTASQSGSTVYGTGGTTGTVLDDFALLDGPVTLTIWDTGGLDTLDLTGSGAGQGVRLAPGAVSSVLGWRNNLVLTRDTLIENAVTGIGNDRVVGNDARNRITLGAGDDMAWGGRGSDALFGGDGNDRLMGGTEGDWLNGGDGSDHLLGEHGNDRLFGGEGSDRLLGSSGIDRLYGDAGNDRLEGGDHNDYLAGGAGADRLYGGNGKDRLYGGEGDDWLAGGSLRDCLSGGAGNDLLYGGREADIFIFEDGWGRDRIADMRVSGRHADRIDLSRVSAIESWSDLRADHLAKSGASCMIVSGEGDSILLSGIRLSDLSADDFIF